MEFERYGIKLRSIQTQDLETVRQWRNAPHVQRNMAYQNGISPESHIKWYAGLNPRKDFYFLASEKEVAFAVLHVKEIPGEEEAGEAGIFVGNTRFLEEPTPVQAILALNDLFFFLFGYKRLEAKVKVAAAANVELNRGLGYVFAEYEETEGFARYTLNPQDYVNATRIIRDWASKTSEASSVLRIGEGEKWLLEKINQKKAAEMEIKIDAQNG